MDTFSEVDRALRNGLPTPSTETGADAKLRQAADLNAELGWGHHHWFRRGRDRGRHQTSAVAFNSGTKLGSDWKSYDWQSQDFVRKTW